MANWIAKKSRSQFNDFVERVDAQNAELGLNRSVDEKELALDYLLPYREEHIEQYVERNDFSKSAYIEALREEVDKPVPLIAYLTIFGITLLYGFSGPLVYELTGLTFIAEYLVGFLILILVCLVGYLLL
jgi:hypothetical protein